MCFNTVMVCASQSDSHHNYNTCHVCVYVCEWGTIVLRNHISTYIGHGRYFMEASPSQHDNCRLSIARVNNDAIVVCL